MITMFVCWCNDVFNFQNKIQFETLKTFKYNNFKNSDLNFNTFSEFKFLKRFF